MVLKPIVSLRKQQTPSRFNFMAHKKWDYEHSLLRWHMGVDFNSSEDVFSWFCVWTCQSWGRAEPWWVAVVSSCDTGDGDRGGFSSALCACTGFVSVGTLAMGTLCGCSVAIFSLGRTSQTVSNTSPLGQSYRWTISSAAASSVLWPEKAFERSPS